MDNSCYHFWEIFYLEGQTAHVVPFLEHVSRNPVLPANKKKDYQNPKKILYPLGKPPKNNSSANGQVIKALLLKLNGKAIKALLLKLNDHRNFFSSSV